MWPVPDCLKGVRQFLGFVGYYRRFIPNFADHAAPLVALTGKDVPFVWEPACSDSFYTLRNSLIQALILAFPTETGEYILDTNASNFGLVECGVRFKTMWNMWLLIAAVLLDLHKDVIAQRNVRCWLLCLCAYNFVPTYVVPSSPFVLTTNHVCGYTGSRIPKV